MIFRTLDDESLSQLGQIRLMITVPCWLSSGKSRGEKNPLSDEERESLLHSTRVTGVFLLNPL